MFYKLYSLLVRINDLFIAKTGSDPEKKYDFGEFYIVKSQMENFFIMDKHLEDYFVKSSFSDDYIIDGLRKKPPL